MDPVTCSALAPFAGGCNCPLPFLKHLPAVLFPDNMLLLVLLMQYTSKCVLFLHDMIEPLQNCWECCCACITLWYGLRHKAQTLNCHLKCNSPITQTWALLPWPSTHHPLLRSHAQCRENQICSHVGHKPCLKFNDQASKQLKHLKKCSPLLHSPRHTALPTRSKGMTEDSRGPCSALAAAQSWWHKKAAKKSHQTSLGWLQTKISSCFFHFRKKQSVTHR